MRTSDRATNREKARSNSLVMSHGSRRWVMGEPLGNNGSDRPMIGSDCMTGPPAPPGFLLTSEPDALLVTPDFSGAVAVWRKTSSPNAPWFFHGRRKPLA